MLTGSQGIDREVAELADRCLAREAAAGPAASDPRLHNQFAVVSQLGAKHVPDELACLLHFWKCQRTMDLFAIAVGRYHAGRFKDGQMLRDIRQRDAKRGLEIGNGLPALCEKVEHSETGRVGERFANAHLHFEDLFFDSGLLPLRMGLPACIL